MGPQNGGYETLAWNAEHGGDLKTAAHWYREAATYARMRNQPESQLMALSNLAEMYARNGNYKEAVETATYLLTRARDEQLIEYEMRATGRLVEALLAIDPRSRWADILPLLRDGLTKARQFTVNYWEVYFLILLGTGYVAIGDLTTGFQRLQEANTCIDATTDDHDYLEASVWSSLAKLMLKAGNDTEAVRYAEQAAGVAKRGKVSDFAARAQLTLAQAERGRGQLGEALHLASHVRSQARKFGWLSIEQPSEYLCGVIERELGHPDIALVATNRALELARDMQSRERQVESLINLAKNLYALGRDSEARPALEEAIQVSQERNFDDLLSEAEQLLLARTRKDTRVHE